MSERRTAPYVLLLTIAALLVCIVLYPVWQPLFLGGVFATALGRPHARLTLLFGGRRGLAAVAVTVVCVLLLIGPVASVAVIAVQEALDALVGLRRMLTTESLANLITRLPHPLSDVATRLRDIVPPVAPKDMAGDFSTQLLAGSQWAAGLAGGALRFTSELAFNIGIMLVAMHVLLIDGFGLLAWITDISPLPRDESQALLIEFKKATRAILTSTLATAGAQGVLATVGYLIAEAPRPIFFGLVTLLCAFIPGVGTALVALPIVAYLFFTGHAVAAGFLAVYFVLVVSMVDNLLKPLLMKQGMRMHGAVVFLSLIGGVLSLGGVGLVAGPLALTFFLAMVRLRTNHVEQNY